MINQVQEKVVRGQREKKKMMIQPVAEEITQPCDALYDFVQPSVAPLLYP
jgi:hypothetical protein